MTRKELLNEHRECDRQPDRRTAVIYKTLHLRRRGCPACAKLRHRPKRGRRRAYA